jgi:ribonuclease P protein component
VRRDLRLRKNSDFQRVRQAGKSVANQLLVLVHAANPEGQTRFGFAVGKKLGHAVERNKMKRRLREQVRLHIRANRLREGVDVVIIARPAASSADPKSLGGALDELIGRAGLWRRENA